MRFDQLINEHIVNLLSKEDREKYKNDVWNLMQQAYAKAGGFKSAVSPEELVDTTHLWKLVVRKDATGNRRITAANIYRDQHGRKSVASGSDGTIQGKKDYAMIKNEDIKLMRAWAEVSGAPEAIFRKAGAVPISNKFAAELTGKEIVSYNPDGYHYTRMILGEPHEKVIYGWPKLSPEDLQKIQAKTGETIQTKTLD